MNTSQASWLPRLYRWAFLSVIAVLPISHTTGLRNLLLVFLLVLLAIHAVRERHVLPELWRKVKPVLPWPLVLWFVFLFLFPLWAVYPDEAWANLREQWGQSMLAWLIGFGTVWVLGTRGPGLWALALASAFPLALHLLVTLAAWAGLLGQPVPMAYSFQEVTARLAELLSGRGSWAGWQSLQLPFRGVEDMHGNMGYAANQAMALLCVLLVQGWRGGPVRQAWTAFLIMGVCLISLLVASSRGGILFFPVILVAAVLVGYLRHVFSTPEQKRPRSAQTIVFWMAGLILGMAVAGMAWNVISQDSRWRTMYDKMSIGLSLPRPANVLCEGLSPEQEQQIRREYSHRESAYVDYLLAGIQQDIGRMLLMRVGLDLVRENPRGQDGARGSYQKLIERKCGHVPVMTFAHLHQSWMDLALGLGWAGATLFAWVLLYFLRAGWHALDRPAAAHWGLALLLLAGFWFLRGFTDSLYREHYLQMQALLMAYLYGRILIARSCPDGSHPLQGRESSFK